MNAPTGHGGAEQGPTLEDLLVECLERLEHGGEAGLEGLLAEHPTKARALRLQLERLRATGMLALTRSTASGDFPERIGDFRLLRRLGEGGMGVVFLAEQISLGRQVALKLVRPEGLFLGGARERFRREVEAVARLSHPSIVPVHTVGEAEGIPFYAMEYVPGLTLSEVIAELRDRPPQHLRGADLRRILDARRASGASDSSSAEEGRRFAGSWSECCLSIVRDVALALAHVHERGVLHRDVKPSNLLLRPSGRVLLFDFGLAALQGSERLTRSGAQLGSLAYMAPEQIEGRSSSIGPTTDVYGLGITLYELLCLRLPYRSTSQAELARRILDGRPDPLRRHNPAVAADVETIVSTAIDPDPARRYADAEAFARDLSNALELRPITARRQGPALRLRRFTQRHPGWSTAAALGLLVAVGGPLGYARQQRAARVEIGRQRDLAARNLSNALEAVRFMTRVGQDELAAVPAAEQARRKLLEGALTFYQRMAGERDGSELEIASARLLVGEILWRLGRLPEAREALDATIRVFEQAGDALDPALRRELFAARTLQVDALRLSGEPVAARDLLQRMIDDFGDLGGREDGDRTTLLERADTHRRMADVQKRAGDRNRALVELRRSAEMLENLGERLPLDVGVTVREVGSLTRLGQLELQTGDAQGAERSLSRALDRLGSIAAEDAATVQVREQAAVTEIHVAALRFAQGDEVAARSHALRGIELAELLDREFPSTPKHRNQLAVNWTELGAQEANLGHFESAAEHYGKSVVLFEDLCARFPGTPTYVSQLATAQVGRAKLLIDAGQFDECLASCARALERVEGALELDPQDAQARRTRELLRIQRCRALLAQDRLPELAAGLEEIGSFLEPIDLVACARLAATCSQLLRAEEALHDPERATRSEGCIALALSFIGHAAEQGLRDGKALLGDPALAPLRERAAFRDLCASMAD